MSKAKRTRKMPGKAPRTSPTGPPPEAFDGLDEWAAGVAKCVTSEELGVLLGIYTRLASDRHVSAANRRLADSKVDALRRASRRVKKTDTCH